MRGVHFHLMRVPRGFSVIKSKRAPLPQGQKIKLKPGEALSSISNMKPTCGVCQCEMEGTMCCEGECGLFTCDKCLMEDDVCSICWQERINDTSASCQRCPSVA